MHITPFAPTAHETREVQKNGRVGSGTFCFVVRDVPRSLTLFLAPYAESVYSLGLSSKTTRSVLTDLGLDEESPLQNAYTRWTSFLLDQFSDLEKQNPWERAARVLPVGVLEDISCEVPWALVDDLLLEARISLDPMVRRFYSKVMDWWEIAFGDPWHKKMSQETPPWRNVALKSPRERGYKEPFRTQTLGGVPRSIRARVENHPSASLMKRAVIEGVLSYMSITDLVGHGFHGIFPDTTRMWDELWLPQMDEEKYGAELLSFQRALQESDDPGVGFVSFYGAHTGALCSFVWVLDGRDADRFLKTDVQEDLVLVQNHIRERW